MVAPTTPATPNASPGSAVNLPPDLHNALLSQFLQGHRLTDLAAHFNIPLDTLVDWVESPAVRAFIVRLKSAAETQRDAILALSLPACVYSMTLAATDPDVPPAERRRAAALALGGRSSPPRASPSLRDTQTSAPPAADGQAVAPDHHRPGATARPSSAGSAPRIPTSPLPTSPPPASNPSADNNAPRVSPSA